MFVLSLTMIHIRIVVWAECNTAGHAFSLRVRDVYSLKCFSCSVQNAIILVKFLSQGKVNWQLVAIRDIMSTLNIICSPFDKRIFNL